MTEHGRFERHAVQVMEAQRKIEPFIRTLQTEYVELEEALGRRLALDITADVPLPHFRRSGMDGFAVRSADLGGASPSCPVRLDVIETIPCGGVPAKSVAAGQASRIMTGAMLPEGADCVIMLEMAREGTDGGKPYITVAKLLPPGTNLSEIGSEIREGTPLLSRGTRIAAGETAILAAFGHWRVPVCRKPNVGVIATGSELLEIREPLQPGKIRNSNLSMLSAMVKQAGGTPLLYGKVSDDKELALRTIEEAFREADLVVTSGGVSVGDYDILTGIFATWDGDMLFNKIAMRPGSPTTAGVRDGKFLFALSGNPGACFVGFQLFVRPVIQGMQGAERLYPEQGTAFLAEDYGKVNAYTRYVRGKCRADNGRLLAAQVGLDQSGILSDLKDADCLIVIPPGGGGKKAGELVEVLYV